MHGQGHEALQKFEEITRTSTRTNEVTFLAIPTACCHSGLVDEGRRVGLLGEAQKLIKTMPRPPDVLTWGAILSACKTTGNVELSREMLDRLLELESQDSGAYLLQSNIDAGNERWAEVTRMRRVMKEKGIKKAPGSSVIEVNGQAHECLLGDSSHPENEDIHVVLSLLTNQEFS